MFDLIKKYLGNKEIPKLELAGREEHWEWRGHRITYSVLGEGAPVLTLHGINASAWGFEVRNNLESFATQYRVYAPDLPGFGRSERKPMRYTAELYIEFLVDFARYVARREGQAPAAMALSLIAAHLVGAVNRAPKAFGPLLLVCPTGLERLDFPPSEKSLKAHKILSGPVGSVLYRILTTRFSTRIFLGRDGYYDPAYIDAALIDGYWRSARLPKAKYAPIAFLTFSLNHSIKEEWPNIKQPVLLVWGRQAKITPLANTNRFIETRPGTELVVIDHARLAPQDECSAEFNKLALAWFSENYRPVSTTGSATATLI